MSNVIGTVVKLDTADEFGRTFADPEMCVKGDDGELYRFSLRSWAQLGQRVVINVGMGAPMLVGLDGPVCRTDTAQF